ncbi:MAG: ABC transporter substrate-binding protein [Candidatus Hodarchaeales archaeon]|jgi:peptide/nickel transport system substrate-binding protein
MKQRNILRGLISQSFRTQSKVLLLALSSVLILLATATNSSIGTFAAVRYPDTLIIETINAPDTLDPASSYESFGIGVIDGIYESLVTYGHEASDLQGELAESWDIAPDGLSVTFTIEPGHFFVLPETGYNPNIEINAWHVKYSIDRINIMADPSGYGWMLDDLILGSNSFQDLNISEAQDYIAASGVEVLGDNLVRVNLKYAYSAAVTIFAFNAGVVVNPVWIAENAPASYTKDSGTMTEIDNTTGQFSFTDWFAGKNVTEIMVDKLGFDPAWDPLDSGVVPSTGVDHSYRHEAMTFSACGSGPYYIVPSETTYGQAIMLKKNTKWEGFVSGQGGSTWPDAPDRILIKTVNEVNTRLLDLLAGECDLPVISTSFADQVIDIDKFLNDGTLDPLYQQTIAHIAPGLTVIQLGMNQRSFFSDEWLKEAPDSTYNASDWKPYSWSSTYFSDNRSKYNNPFANYLFRLAFIKSFATDTFIDQTLNGFGTVPEGVIPQGIMGHHDLLIDYGYQPGYDPDGAKAVFAQLGWKGSINITFNEGSITRNVSANLLKDTIESMDVGISINILEVPWPEYLMTYGNSPIYLIGWVPDFADPDNFVSPFYETFFGPLLNYSNPLVSELINLAKADPDMARREQLYFNIEQNASLDFPFIPLYQSTNFYLRRDWVNGDLDSILNPMRCLFQPWERLVKVDLISPTTTTTTLLTTTTTTDTATTTTTTTTTDTATTTTETTTSESTETTDTSEPSISSTTTIPEITLGFDLMCLIPILLIGAAFKFRRKKKNLW